LDSHQHVHRNEPARSICLAWAERLGIPLRECQPGIRYCGDFYGQGAECEPLPDSLTVPALERILAALPAGTTELGCHPGYDDGLATAYRQERAQEVEVLCDPRLRDILKQLSIGLCSQQPAA
jgi:chitin disaccharide deacetylase